MLIGAGASAARAASPPGWDGSSARDRVGFATIHRNDETEDCDGCPAISRAHAGGRPAPSTAERPAWARPGPRPTRPRNSRRHRRSRRWPAADRRAPSSMPDAPGVSRRALSRRCARARLLSEERSRRRAGRNGSRAVVESGVDGEFEQQKRDETPPAAVDDPAASRLRLTAFDTGNVTKKRSRWISRSALAAVETCPWTPFHEPRFGPRPADAPTSAARPMWFSMRACRESTVRNAHSPATRRRARPDRLSPCWPLPPSTAPGTRRRRQSAGPPVRRQTGAHSPMPGEAPSATATPCRASRRAVLQR